MIDDNEESDILESRIIETENDWEYYFTDDIVDKFDNIREYINSKGLILLNRCKIDDFLNFAKAMSSSYPIKEFKFIRRRLTSSELRYLDRFEFYISNIYLILNEFDKLEIDIFLEFIIKFTELS